MVAAKVVGAVGVDLVAEPLVAEASPQEVGR
jgi:hypothetical protein